MTEKMIIDAYCRIRTINNTIPDDVLDFMKDAAIEKLRKHDDSNCYTLQDMINTYDAGVWNPWDETAKEYMKRVYNVY